MQTTELTIFYDSQCPLCLAEMNKLKQQDTKARINFVSLHDEDSLQVYPELDRSEAMTILQGRLTSGQYIEGLDVTHQAWSLVGKGAYTAILRWPILKICFDVIYRIFAKHRYGISALLTGKRRTYETGCRCGLADKGP